MAITAAMVKELRETTGAGMMDAKKALTETDGNMEAAIDWLRTKGLAKAAKKADRVAAEGLIELLPNRGARVRQLSQRDLEELFDVMAGLESLAGRLACEAITDEEIAAIERLHYEMYGHYLHRDMHGYFQTNQQIHESIVAAARNATLKTTYANFAGRIRRVRY